MAAYRILIKPSAVKELEALAKRHRQHIAKRIQGLSQDPRPPGCEKLSAEEKYRFRRGQYRVIYAVDDAQRTVVVVKIGHRREVYR